ncbi:MAG: hypothetical protein U5L04_11170 [Trueperaceae bacterium]|nr:hypothetical protein [Trueperaceae bacterium]
MTDGLEPTVLQTVRDHQPSPAHRRRAAEAGIDLDALKRDDPLRYAIANAEAILRAPAQLVPSAGAVTAATLPQHQLFDLPPHSETGRVVLLLFPPPSAAEQARLDDAFAALVDRPEWRQHYAYYRVVRDRNGEHRELDVPLEPSVWSGENDVMVGPFVTEAAASTWSEQHVPARHGLAADVLRYADVWFCDLFAVSA